MLLQPPRLVNKTHKKFWENSYGNNKIADEKAGFSFFKARALKDAARAFFEKLACSKN
jgi:hypothetical protein